MLVFASGTSAPAEGPENAIEPAPAPAAAEISLPPAPEQELRGVWFHTYSPQDWDAVCGRLKEAGINAIFVRVGRGGNVIYDSEYLPKDRFAEEAGIDELANICEAARKAGLQFHAWRVNYHMGSAPKWYRQRMSEEGRLARDPEGTEAKFANPGDPRNALLEYRVMMEMVEKYPIDGLHLDYIRYTEVPSYDFDYGEVSRREFERVLGRRVPSWPNDVRFGPLRLAYDNWMRSNIDGLVHRVALGIRQRKPDVMLSAAVWPRHRRYWTLIKQDWPKWVREGWLDFVVPMDYSKSDERFESLVREQVGVCRGVRPVVPGIGGWLLKDGDQLVRQVAITRRYGTAGFVIFAYNADNIDELLAAVRDRIATNESVPMDNLVRFRVELPEAEPRRDDAFAAVKDRPMRVLLGVSMRPGLFREVERIRSEFFWVDPAAGSRRRLGAGTGRARAAWRGSVTPPEGLSQPWVRTEIIFLNGARRTVWRRGPLVEGMEAGEYERWVAQDHPPQVEGPGLRVGVYQPGLGAERWVESLGADPALNVFLLHRLRADHLAVCDVVVIPQLVDASLINTESYRAVRAWVRKGGRLILLHDAVGFRLHPPLFAEIGRADRRIEDPGEIVVAEDWKKKLGLDDFRTGYDDYLALLPGEKAEEILARDPEGDPVAVAGRWGRGEVVLLGTIFAYPSDREILPGERDFLKGLLEWLGEGVR